MESSKSGMLFLGVFLAIGLTLSGYFIGQTMYNGKVALNTAEAKGLAERIVKANKADWRIDFSRNWKTESPLEEQYNKAEKDQQEIINFLTDNGISKEDIHKGIINYSKKDYRNKEQKLIFVSYNLYGSVSVSTQNVESIPAVRNKINRLLTKGINLDNNAPSYRFTKLNEIKPQMLEEATKNARIAANEFAKNANARVAGIRNARQGSFYVRDDGQDYGDTQKITKKVRVVTTITFYLKDSI